MAPEGFDPRRRTLLATLVALGGTTALAPAAVQAQAGRTSESTPSGTAESMPAIGSSIALPPVKLLDGRDIAPDYWRGKVLVVERWATWCPFCANQNPNLDRLHRAQGANGLEVLGLSIDKDPAVVRKYMTDRKYAFHAAMMTDAWTNALGRTRKLPVVWVVGRDGKLKEVIPGEMFPDDVEQLARWLKA
jgi:thiol-disulfide isomerase/thioredoxin